jgi:hypothetical protein
MLQYLALLGYSSAHLLGCSQPASPGWRMWRKPPSSGARQVPFASRTPILSNLGFLAIEADAHRYMITIFNLNQFLFPLAHRRSQRLSTFQQPTKCSPSSLQTVTGKKRIQRRENPCKNGYTLGRKDGGSSSSSTRRMSAGLYLLEKCVRRMASFCTMPMQSADNSAKVHF